MSEIALDFETAYRSNKTKTEDAYSVTKMGNWRYCHDERFDPYMISVADSAESWAGAPSAFNWSALEGATIISHNAGFDKTVYETMVELGKAPKVNYKAWVDSAGLTKYICGRASLAASVEFLFGEQVNKSMRAYMNGKSWTEAIADGKADRLLEYARLDSVKCLQLWQRFSDQWPEHERALSQLTMDTGSRGIAIDITKLNSYLQIAQESIWEIEGSLPWIHDDRAPTSTKAISEECGKHGIPCPPVKSHDGGEEAFAAWEAEYLPRFSWVAGVANWRSMNKFFGTLETIKDRLRPDGTIECGVQYFGAHTGRWSGESGLNFQNFRKVPIYLDDRRMPTEDPEKAKRALDIRSLLIPRPGKKMISSDLSQIEPRVLAWMAGNKAFLEQVREGMSTYEAHARNCPHMKWAGGDLKEENRKMYDRAKVEVLALGYGAGAVKYIEMARTIGGYNVTEEESGEHVRSFRESNPGIVKLWERLDNSFKASCGGTFEMELPSGRGMRYYKVRREPRMYRGKDGKAQRKIVFTADIGGKHKPLYGGLLTENLVQATARDVFAEHLLELSRTPGIKPLFTVHDEAVLEVDEGVTAKDVEDIMSKTPEWIPGCPIAAEASEIPHYTKE